MKNVVVYSVIFGFTEVELFLGFFSFSFSLSCV
jgi:hypothetical protein